jgi:hypothetical protein
MRERDENTKIHRKQENPGIKEEKEKKDQKRRSSKRKGRGEGTLGRKGRQRWR